MANLTDEELAAMDPVQRKNLLEMLGNPDLENLALLQAQQRQQHELAQRRSLIEQENLQAYRADLAAQQEQTMRQLLDDLLQPGRPITEETARQAQAIFDSMQQASGAVGQVVPNLQMTLPYQSNHLQQLNLGYQDTVIAADGEPLTFNNNSRRHVEICRMIESYQHALELRRKQDAHTVLELIQQQESQLSGNNDASQQLLDFRSNRQLQEHL